MQQESTLQAIEQTPTRSLRQAALYGALAGLTGGLVFGAAMAMLGVLPTVASLVRANSPLAGFCVHMTIAAIVGAGFGLLVWHQRTATGEMLFWGLAYGVFWWFLGPLTLMPLLLGNAVLWDMATAQAAFPSLMGHLWYGAIMALALTYLSRDRSGLSERASLGAVAGGAIAGLLAAWLVGALLDAQGQLLAFASMMMHQPSAWVGWTLLLAIGALSGMGLALLYPRAGKSGGVGLVRGFVYGFVWWVIGAQTLIPLFYGGHLGWSLDDARASFAFLPAFLILGGTLGLFHRWLGELARILFTDITPDPQNEGAGARGLRALGRGVAAGVVGGLLFTFIMVQIGFLPAVASLIGATSSSTGLIVHLVISVLIGASYGLLFQRQSYDFGSGLGWGLSYGFFWWILGPLTFMPILLGQPPQWSVAVASGLIASLVGHLLYGAGLGVTFHLLEAHYNPWWIPRRQVRAARVAHHKEQIFSSAPALWAMVVAMVLLMPVLLAPPLPTP